MDESVFLQALAKAISPYVSGQSGGYAQGYKAAGTPIGGPYLYEGGGLFGRCDGSSDLINALVGPIGFEKVLTWRGTDTEKEFVDAWTDIVETGSNQSTACGDCQTASMRACSQFYCFGRFCRQSQELQFDRLGVRANSSVPIKNLFGSITAADGTVLVPQGSAITDDFYMQTALVGYAIRLRNAQLLWNGNTINNSGAYAEYNGFQVIVNTGKFDAYTQLACAALDSFIPNIGNQALTTDGALAARSWTHRMVNQFKVRADRAGLDWDTAQMYLVMTPNMWDCFARVYACAGLDLCSVSGSRNQVFANADQAQSRYEQYLTSMSVPIDGRMYPVVLDSQIPETAGQANGICSDIYFITTEISGRTVTYGNYQDFNKTYGRIRNEMVSMFGSDDIAITDNGRFALVRDNVRGCFDIQAYTKPRLVAEMPQLLGRMRNVCCSVTAEPYPDVTGSNRVYEKSGGRTITPVPTLYSQNGQGVC